MGIIYDVSTWQKGLDLRNLKDCDGVIIRCGFGEDAPSQDDNACADFVAQAKKYGIPFGLYLFSEACVNFETSVKSEIKHAQRLHNKFKPTLGMWLDIEDDNYKGGNGWKDYQHADQLKWYIGQWLGAFPDGGVYCDRSHQQFLKVKANKLWIATLDGTKVTDCVMCQYSESNNQDKNSKGKYWNEYSFTPNGGCTPHPTDKLNYQAHVQDHGWLAKVGEGQTAGTTGYGLRMEAIKVFSNYANFKIWVHVQNKGDIGPFTNGQTAGTTGKSLRVEAVKIECDKKIQYRLHIQNIGWTPWVSNGQWCGTKGKSLRAEAIEIKFV